MARSRKADKLDTLLVEMDAAMDVLLKVLMEAKPLILFYEMEPTRKNKIKSFILMVDEYRPTDAVVGEWQDSKFSMVLQNACNVMCGPVSQYLPGFYNNERISRNTIEKYLWDIKNFLPLYVATIQTQCDFEYSRLLMADDETRLTQARQPSSVRTLFATPRT
jgi:hypothetical protein